MDLTYSQIAKVAKFSNEKMVDLIKQKLAESENAAVALVFDDKLIVLDESDDKFYSVKYEIKDKALCLNDWEPVNLIADNDSRLESLAEMYFDPTGKEEITKEILVEAFKLKFADEPVRRLLNTTCKEKKSMVESIDRIKALKEVRNAREYFTDDIADIVEDAKIQAVYTKISESAPVQGTLAKIDFKSPLSVSLFEEGSDKAINLSERKKCAMRSYNIKKKVANEWTSDSFREDFKKLVDDMAKAEDAKKLLEDFVKQHVEITILEANELEDLILKTALMIGEAAKSDGLVELFRELHDLDEIKEMRDDFISRNNISEEGEVEEPMEEPESPEGEDKDKGKKAEKKGPKETTIDEDSINKILKVLNKIQGSLKDKTMESRYIKSFVSALEDAKVGSISEGKLKEILDFLTSIYEQASEGEAEEE